MIAGEEASLNRQLRLRPILISIVAAMLAVSLKLSVAGAYSPYTTYYKDGYGQLVQIQSAYHPDGVIGRSPASALNQPQDLFVDEQDQIYIADTGNNRIIQLNEQGEFVRALEVQESPLNRPSGLYVAPGGDIYIADTGNQRVVRLAADGKLIREYARPTSSYLPDSFKYEPTKLVVDKRGFLYITTLGAFQGLLQLDPQGEFQNFFGSNKVEFSLFDAFKRLFYTREMYRRELSKLPGAIVNTAIDHNGFIYTVTKEIKQAQVKKLNIAGLDQLEHQGEFMSTGSKEARSFGEMAWGANRSSQPQLQDVTVDLNGNMTVIDSLSNTISQYDENGNLLFFWGGYDNAATSKLGLVKTPAAIAATSTGDLLVLDSVNGLVQKLRLTEFGTLVHQANKLTQEGRYEESETLWEEVYRQNAYYTPALIGLAKAAYKKEEYTNAEQLFFKAGINQGYSDAFWQTRLAWFQQNFALLMNILLLLALISYLFNRLTRKSKWRMDWQARVKSERPLLLQLKHIGYIMRHPIDGYHAIRYHDKAGTASSLIVLGAALLSFAFIQAKTGFIFNTDIYEGVKLGPLLAQFIFLWLGWTTANYLVSSLMRGEGRLRDVFYGSSYALFPIVFVGVPLTILSHAFSLSEQSIFGFLQMVMLIWTLLNFFWMVQGIQNYSVGEALLNIVLSLLALAIIGVLIFIFISLSGELVNFIYSIYQEVIIR
ncbi:nuclease PIN [Paenibacillaceae bacterium]|nr:nuclease PIN [Paenibacillaceae bacterium]